MSRIDVARRAVALTVAVPGRPHNLAALPGGGAVVTLPGEGRIVLVDARGRPTTVRLGGHPRDVTVAGRLLVVNTAGTGSTWLGWKVGGSGPYPLRGRPHDLAVTVAGRRAWVSRREATRSPVVDLRTRTAARYLSTGRRPTTCSSTATAGLGDRLGRRA